MFKVCSRVLSIGIIVNDIVVVIKLVRRIFNIIVNHILLVFLSLFVVFLVPWKETLLASSRFPAWLWLGKPMFGI